MVGQQETLLRFRILFSQRLAPLPIGRIQSLLGVLIVPLKRSLSWEEK